MILIRFAIFFVIAFIQIILDPTILSCKSYIGTLLIIFHHMLQWYFFIGSILFNHHKLHLIIVILALVIHKIFTICPLSIFHNKLCKFEEKKPLVTILNRVVPNYPNNIKNVIHLYYTLIICVIIYDFIIINKWKL